MQTKNVRDQTMSNAALALEARTKATALVRREEYRVRSRMLAYENIGQMVGRSGSWVRQFVGGHIEACSNVLVWMNIIEAYRRICERTEQLADRLENADETNPGSMARCESTMETRKPTNRE